WMHRDRKTLHHSSAVELFSRGEAARMTRAPRSPIVRWATMLAGLALLNAAVTFDNVWPTPAVRWSGAFSVELASVLLTLLALWRWRGRPATATPRGLSGLLRGVGDGGCGEVG